MREHHHPIRKAWRRFKLDPGEQLVVIDQNAPHCLLGKQEGLILFRQGADANQRQRRIEVMGLSERHLELFVCEGRKLDNRFSLHSRATDRSALTGSDYGPGFFGMYDPLGRNLYASLQFEF